MKQKRTLSQARTRELSSVAYRRNRDRESVERRHGSSEFDEESVPRVAVFAHLACHRSRMGVFVQLKYLLTIGQGELQSFLRWLRGSIGAKAARNLVVAIAAR